MSHANSAIAAQDWPAALKALASASEMAEALKLGRHRIEILSLRALALERNGEKGHSLLQEAMNLAQTFGLARIFVDAHPTIADWARCMAEEGAAGIDAGRAASVARVPRVSAHRNSASPRAVPSMVLTAKEREVLELVARNLSNKEIAQAMELSDQTVKWHLKNLFAKLDAATRKHAVRRAQLLGLLEGGE
jgi:LuxR family maltose regulon positive regulatory protein